MSLALVPLIGLILNYTPWGIRLLPSLLSLYVFMFAMSLIAFLRRRALAEEERFSFDIRKMPAQKWNKSPQAADAEQPDEVLEQYQGGNLFNRYSITGLATLVLFTIGLIISTEAWQIGLGIPIVLAAGYLLAGIIFPHDDDLSFMERVFMSLCFSILLVLLTAVITTGISNYMKVTTDTSAIFTAFSVISIILATAAALLRYRLTRAAFPVWRIKLKGTATGKIRWLDLSLNVLLALAILAAIGAIVYTVTAPKTGEKFTEFYILGLEGKAENYPRELKLGEDAGVILGIVNREYEPANYKYAISIDGDTIAEYGPIALENEEKWE